MRIYGQGITNNTWDSVGIQMVKKIMCLKSSRLGCPLPATSLLRYWRGRDLKAIAYLDDRIIAVKEKQRQKLRAVKLEKVGFITNIEKCVKWSMVI